MPGAENTFADENPGVCIRQDITDLLAGFSLEMTSDIAQTAPDLASQIPAGTHVYLPFLPNTAFADCVPAAERLAREGMVPVLHIAARRLTGSSELADVLDRLRETCELSSTLVIAGDVGQVAGPYQSAIELLETGLLEKHGISAIGIAGYPEPHPAISETLVWDALARKCEYAKTSVADFKIVSQFTFSYQSVLRWENELKQAGITLPVLLSVPGPAKLTTLLGYARMCGVSASLRQLTRNTRALAGLASISTPDRLLTAIARSRAGDEGSLITGIHFNTFGGFGETARWVKSVLEGRIAITSDKTGFKAKRS